MYNNMDSLGWTLVLLVWVGGEMRHFVEMCVVSLDVCSVPGRDSEDVYILWISKGTTFREYMRRQKVHFCQHQLKRGLNHQYSVCRLVLTMTCTGATGWSLA